MEGQIMRLSPPASVNHWHDRACARAFSGQHEIPPYRQLLQHTAAWLEPRPGDRWLDLGCGSGQLTHALWALSEGQLEEVVALDCAASNQRAVDRLKASLPAPCRGRLRFVHANFSAGLGSWETDHFDGVVSGLAIHYAESYSQERGRWTTDAYDHLLTEVFRVLRPGGGFVFSVMVPKPACGKLALATLGGILQAPRPSRFLKSAWRMWRYASWLKREARRGRFHYLPLPSVLSRLQRVGFDSVQHRLSYADQAFLFRCRKPFD
jgi:ubiquinone/menaquinone biosynthesis C-methylase UbiE